MLPRIFYPSYVTKKKLIRIGPNKDGGYVVHKDILKNIHYIISCGLNDDWSFEKYLIKHQKNCHLLFYDHTVTKKFWLRYTVKNFIDFLLLKKLTLKKILNIFKFFEYKFFFKYNKKHYIKKIGNKNSNKETTIDNIFNKLPLKKKIILKIDIEGDEYKILNDIKKHEKKIDHLIIEFHNVYKNLNKIENFLKKNKLLKLLHIHANNYDNIIQGIPNTIEMTFVNKLNYKKNVLKKKIIYPIQYLDFPNHKTKKDIEIKFLND